VPKPSTIAKRLAKKTPSSLKKVKMTLILSHLVKQPLKKAKNKTKYKESMI